jgi:hypothetical protein
VRGKALAVAEPVAVIRIVPERIVSWGLEDGAGGRHRARSPG